MSNPVLDIIRKRCAVRGEQKKLAAEIGISPAYMNDVIRGKRGINERIGAHFGYEQVWRKVRG